MSSSCAALLKGFLDTPPRDVYVEWDGKEKSFDIRIRVCDADTGKTLDAYAKSVPVRIAEASLGGLPSKPASSRCFNP